MKKAKVKKEAAPAATETAAAVETPSAPPIGEFKIVPRLKIRPDPNQPRKTFKESDLQELAASIKQHGIAQPLVVQLVPGLTIKEPDMIQKTWQAVDAKGAVVFEGGEEEVNRLAAPMLEDSYQLIFGERRWRASEIAGLVDVPVIVREITDKDRFALQFAENQQRVNLTALEEAQSFADEIARRQQTDPTFSAEKLGETLNLARGTIYNRLRLLRLHGPVRNALEGGVVDASVAGEVAAIPSTIDQEEMLNIIRDHLEGGLPMSVRDVRDYIGRHYMQQLGNAPFDMKEENYFPDGVPTANSDMFPGPCTKCPHRSGNMKEMFPEIQNVNVCTSPTCFSEKSIAHGFKKAEEHRQKGSEVITRDEYLEKHNEFVRATDPVLVGNRYLAAEKVMGKKAPKPILVQKGTEFDEVYRKTDVITAGEANGFDFTPPPKPKVEKKPKPSPAAKAADEAKRKEQEERERKRQEEEEARIERRKKVFELALAELRKRVEARPVNPKSETEFWRFMFSTRQFWSQMIFFNGYKDLFDRRGWKDMPDKATQKLSYQQIRSLTLEAMLTCEYSDGTVDHEGNFAEEMMDACKFAGVDLKKIEREIEDGHGELPGMPEKQAKKAKGTKPKSKKKK